MPLCASLGDQAREIRASATRHLETQLGDKPTSISTLIGWRSERITGDRHTGCDSAGDQRERPAGRLINAPHGSGVDLATDSLDEVGAERLPDRERGVIDHRIRHDSDDRQLFGGHDRLTESLLRGLLEARIAVYPVSLRERGHDGLLRCLRRHRLTACAAEHDRLLGHHLEELGHLFGGDWDVRAPDQFIEACHESGTLSISDDPG